MRVIVAGGRDYNDRGEMFRELDMFHEEHAITVVIHGAQEGADKLAGQWARLNGIDEDATPTGGTRFGMNAVFAARNSRMLLKRPDHVITFPGGPGTRNMIVQAELAGIPVSKLPRVQIAKSRNW
jgi:hypothetical protein